MWIEKLDNPSAIKNIFDVPPELNDVEIVSITIRRDGPGVILELILNERPSRPSPRWQLMDVNAISLKLQLFIIERFLLEGFTTDTKASLHIGGVKGERISVSVTGPNVKMNCSCRFLSVEGITPYRKELPSTSAVRGKPENEIRDR